MSFNQKHICLIAHKLRSRLSYTLTKMTFLISVMILTLLISGVNLRQFSRHQLQPVKQIFYIFIMHMPACQLPHTLSQILFSHLLSNYRGQVTPSQYQSFDLNLVISRFFCYYSNEKPLTVLWETIPHHLEDDFIASISAMKLRITSSREKYVSKPFEYL